MKSKHTQYYAIHGHPMVVDRPFIEMRGLRTLALSFSNHCYVANTYRATAEFHSST